MVAHIWSDGSCCPILRIASGRHLSENNALCVHHIKRQNFPRLCRILRIPSKTTTEKATESCVFIRIGEFSMAGTKTQRRAVSNQNGEDMFRSSPDGSILRTSVLCWLAETHAYSEAVVPTLAG